MESLWTLSLDGFQVWLPAAALLGVGVGVIAGMFGVGGGFLMIPLLHVVLGLPLPFAVGAGLAMTIATATGSLLRYRRLGYAETRFDVLLIGGSMFGVDAGARALARLDTLGQVEIAGREIAALNLAITVGYTVLFAALAAILWFKRGAEAGAPTVPGPLARIRLPPLVDLPVAGVGRVSGPLIGVIGFGNGVLGGLLGVGGGILLIPIMLYGYGFDVRRTAGTGILMVLVVAVVGTVQHARMGNVHLGLVVVLMIGAALAAQVGASLTRTLSANALRRGLAIILLVTAGALIVDSFF
jgi:uncharacterized protein